MFRRDWLQRLIEQIAEFVAKATGYVDNRKYESAIDTVARGWDEVLGVPRELVDRVEAPTLAELLREPAKMRAGAELLTLEARAYAGKGDPLHAAVCYRRAYELYLEARAVDPTDADDAAILELSRFVPPGEVHARYR